MAELATVLDAEFRQAIYVFGLPVPEVSEERSREVMIYTKTACGKAIGQPLSFNHKISGERPVEDQTLDQTGSC